MQFRRMLVQIYSVLLLLFYFKSEGYWFNTSEHSKSVNSVNPTRKIFHLSSLLQYYFSQNINHLFSFQKFSSTEIVPPHPPSITLHKRTLNVATKKKNYLSLSVYLYLLVYSTVCLQTRVQLFR